MRSHHSRERKESVLKKMRPPLNMMITQVSEQEGVSAQTFYNWRYAAKQLGMPVLG